MNSRIIPRTIRRLLPVMIDGRFSVFIACIGVLKQSEFSF